MRPLVLCCLAVLGLVLVANAHDAPGKKDKVVSHVSDDKSDIEGETKVCVAIAKAKGKKLKDKAKEDIKKAKADVKHAKKTLKATEKAADAAKEKGKAAKEKAKAMVKECKM